MAQRHERPGDGGAAPVGVPNPASPRDGLVEPLMPFLPPPEVYLDHFETGRVSDAIADTNDGRATPLASLGPDLSVAVIGASGGIGAALTRRLQAESAVRRVYAFSRTGSASYGDKVVAGEIDLARERSVARAASAAAAGGPLSLVVVATGYLDQGEMDESGEAWRTLDGLALANAFQINTIGPSFVAKHFLPLMADDRKSIFAVLSDRPGHPTTSARYAYDASKAALNSVVSGLAGELAQRCSTIVCVGLYPGEVDTALSESIARSNDSRVVAPEIAAERLLRVADEITPADSGHVLACDV